MSDARSLSPLSAADYDAIAAAVMETGRGRWFLTEYARRNRQADTEMVLGAIARLERLCTVSVLDAAPSLTETARTIAELRGDLDRHGAGSRGERLSSRIQETAAGILEAAEAIQEIAWTLRESGSAPELCDRLDRRATEIFGATTVIEAGANQIEKVADTIAMLDANLRAAAGEEEGAESAQMATPAPAVELHRPAVRVGTDPRDIDVVESGTQVRAPLSESNPQRTEQRYRRLNSMQASEDDISFADLGTEAKPLAEPLPTVSSAQVEFSYSEADLRAIDALPIEERLRFFG